MEKQALNKASAALLVVALQVAAVAYFIVDAIGESGLPSGRGLAPLSALDLLVAAALLAGIAYAALAFRRLLAESRRHEEALAMARGALASLMRERFAQWGLSRGEAEVALYALKGFSPAEIASFRGSATGTVRSQLSTVYAKAGVTGQPMLMALFMEELVDLPAPAA